MVAASRLLREGREERTRKDRPQWSSSSSTLCPARQGQHHPYQLPTFSILPLSVSLPHVDLKGSVTTSTYQPTNPSSPGGTPPTPYLLSSIVIIVSLDRSTMFGFGSSSSASTSSSSSSAPAPGAAPSREERKACWDSRDKYFRCLDANNVPVAGDEKGVCAVEKEGYEKDCGRSWVSGSPSLINALAIYGVGTVGRD